MPRYFFDIDDGIEIIDEIGREVLDAQQARYEAYKVIGDLLTAEGEDSDGLTLIPNIRDGKGRTVMTIRSVIQIEMKDILE